MYTKLDKESTGNTHTLMSPSNFQSPIGKNGKGSRPWKGIENYWDCLSEQESLHVDGREECRVLLDSYVSQGIGVLFSSRGEAMLSLVVVNQLPTVVGSCQLTVVIVLISTWTG